MTDEFDPLLVALVNQKARQLVATHREGVPLSYDDIGFVLGVTQSQARWDYRNGMRKIKKACAKLGVEPSDILGIPASNFAQCEDYAADRSAGDTDDLEAVSCAGEKMAGEQ